MANKEKIKMRINKCGKETRCQVCGASYLTSLELFDLALAQADKSDPIIITLCDLCCDKLFYKTLNASCHVNGMLKDDRRIKIINARNRKRKLSDIRGDG